eukprot:c9772_g1_i3.p1 GENE.c9772_g1_i3~~c9772_g1_i3.p1  ORF type:complete len:236 (-),score=50.29 c9772_g1_i3:107-814(-)
MRCKDGKKVQHLFETCRYNAYHIFPKEQLAAHEIKCKVKTEERLLQEKRSAVSEVMQGWETVSEPLELPPQLVAPELKKDHLADPLFRAQASEPSKGWGQTFNVVGGESDHVLTAAQKKNQKRAEKRKQKIQEEETNPKPSNPSASAPKKSDPSASAPPASAPAPATPKPAPPAQQAAPPKPVPAQAVQKPAEMKKPVETQNANLSQPSTAQEAADGWTTTSKKNKKQPRPVNVR